MELCKGNSVKRERQVREVISEEMGKGHRQHQLFVGAPPPRRHLQVAWSKLPWGTEYNVGPRAKRLGLGLNPSCVNGNRADIGVSVIWLADRAHLSSATHAYNT
jgi:hypothetical protein